MVETDPAGTATFNRYVWQAKQADRQWITCLSDQDGPLFVVCEHTEDLVLVYQDKLRFLQIKTKDRGSWSASVMGDEGIDSLARSYAAARAVGIHEIATFELWLEGPISNDSDTVKFVQNPSTAVKSVRDKIIKNGVKNEWMTDFLLRLVISPDQPTRAHIDAKVIWELGAIWPALSRPELDALYERLLTAAENAQASTASSATVQRHLASARGTFSRDLPSSSEPNATGIGPLRNQILSHSTLIALTPPLPNESIERLLKRMSTAPGSSLLELKMTAGGAREERIRQAQELRADMEIKRQLLLASSENAHIKLEQTAAKLLAMAGATATKFAMSAVSNPAVAARPAEAIAADLLSRPADLAQCDLAQCFGGDGQLIYGYLCHLSDTCQFRWDGQ